ncbi:hypothetical protein RCE24_26090 [Klebsiella variicola subsp. variicola]|uniref:hypothetical protein n=1 Tax=Klebsiella variicola TaxID=244366 RepID=UPI0027E063ED|nr:hypothetical protein [Klebsiella variicola]MDQ5184507.1 hypothetical protein [Klebsiella variicola subsp. variicola]MDQ5272857.1 hypothetical protein [Klebsiella variicola subsp. variicola]
MTNMISYQGLVRTFLSTVWRKRDLRGYIREAALTTAYCMVERMAEDNARADFGIKGWSSDFSAWYDERREHYRKDAKIILDAFACNEAIDEEIQNELEAWND